MYSKETEDKAVTKIAECLDKDFQWFLEKGGQFQGMGYEGGE